MDRTFKTLVFWILITLSAFLLWEVVKAGRDESRVPAISYSTFIYAAQAGKIAAVTITGSEIRGKYINGDWFHLTGPANPAIYLPTLQNSGTEIEFHDAPKQSIPLQLLGTWAPLLLLGAMWIFMIRQLKCRNAPRPPNSNIPQGTINPSTGELR